MPRIDTSLHAFVKAEAASVGQLKRYCARPGCGCWVSDQDHTRSKFCKAHRSPAAASRKYRANIEELSR